MKKFRVICAIIIVVSVLLDFWSFAVLLFSNGFGGAALSRGATILGLPTSSFGYVWILFPIIIVVWLYATSNGEKYPTFEKLMIVLVTLIFIFPWAFTFITIKLSDQKYTQDKAAYNASCRPVTIQGFQYKICPDGNYQMVGVTPGTQAYNESIKVETEAYQAGEFKY